jgi:hypothetical protein
MAARRIPAWRRLLQGNDERAVARRAGIPVHVVDLEPYPVNHGKP